MRCEDDCTRWLSKDREVGDCSLFKPFEVEKERDRKIRRRVDAKRKSRTEARDTLFSEEGGGGGKSITLLEGFQATPARPSDRNNVKVSKSKLV
jgi:hypothetical protein